MNSLFCSATSIIAFRQEVERFLLRNTLPIPVWVGERPDLQISLDIASALYDGIEKPFPADLGILLPKTVDATAELARPLARTWVEPKESALPDRLRDVRRILVVGAYEQLRGDFVRPLLLESYRRPEMQIGFLSGRDQQSLAWMVAKQWAKIADEVIEIGFFSSTSSPKGPERVRVFAEDDCENQDLQAIVSGHLWRRILFQGHGKDDSINLGPFTVCGRNQTVPASDDQLYPRCGYGFPCYKDDDKLIPLNRVPAAEVVMSSCNSGPISGLALYDPKYILLLNAIDGPCKTIASAVSVHDSGFRENCLYINSADEDDCTSLLNVSLMRQHPYPAFWRFGMPTGAVTNQPTDTNQFDIRLLHIFERLQSYIVSGLLTTNHPLYKRLLKLNEKANQYMSRSRIAEDKFTGGEHTRSILMDVQSIDYSLAKLITRNPEDDIMNFGEHYGFRSEMDQQSVVEIDCSCGNKAQEFQRHGFVSSTLSTTCVFCLRCGDKVFRLASAPSMEFLASERLSVGQTLKIDGWARAHEDGPLHIGLFVPSYLREFVTITPESYRFAGRAGEVYEASFTMRTQENIPAQAYYFTVFSVQNIGISTYRQHFGIDKLTG